MNIDISCTGIDVATAILGDFPKQVPKVVSRAINRANTAAKTAAARKIVSGYNIKSREVSATIRLKSSSPSMLRATMESQGGVIPLTKFKAANGAVGAFVQVKKGSGGYIPHAFLTAFKSGHSGVFWRTSHKRLPIKELYGPSVPGMLGTDNVSAFIEERTTQVFNERLDHEVDAVLRGYV